MRYRLAVASCSVHGVAFPELLSGKGYRAESVKVASPVFESLVSRDKPRRPVLDSPPMPHEALAAIRQPFRVGQFTITDGQLSYAARRFEGAAPGVLTFNAVEISAKEIANAAAGGQFIGVWAEGRLMDAGTMSVEMRIPVAPSSFAFQYSGKLDAMELTRLGDYLDRAGRIQISSGTLSEALFDINVESGRARGALRATYRDLRVTIVDRETGSDKGATNRVATILTNELKVKDENIPNKAGVLREGKVDYTRKPEESFLQFVWLALRTGIFEAISLPGSLIP
jgi:hypothetical protein